MTSPVWRALSLDAARSSAAASRSMVRVAPAVSRSLAGTVSLAAVAKVTGRYAAYDKVVLKVGSKGSAVKALQGALRVKPVDGEFGPLTRAAVVRYQKAKHQKATGVVTSAVWRALSADARPKPKPAPQAGTQARAEARTQARAEARTQARAEAAPPSRHRR